MTGKSKFRWVRRANEYSNVIGRSIRLSKDNLADVEHMFANGIFEKFEDGSFVFIDDDQFVHAGVGDWIVQFGPTDYFVHNEKQYHSLYQYVGVGLGLSDTKSGKKDNGEVSDSEEDTSSTSQERDHSSEYDSHPESSDPGKPHEDHPPKAKEDEVLDVQAGGFNYNQPSGSNTGEVSVEPPKSDAAESEEIPDHNFTSVYKLARGN